VEKIVDQLAPYADAFRTGLNSLALVIQPVWRSLCENLAEAIDAEAAPGDSWRREYENACSSLLVASSSWLGHLELWEPARPGPASSDPRANRLESLALSSSMILPGLLR